MFILDDLQAFDLLEGEAHYAAVLALVLEVDGLVVMVDEDLAQYGRGATAELGLIGRATPNLPSAWPMLFAPSARCAGPSSVRP